MAGLDYDYDYEEEDEDECNDRQAIDSGRTPDFFSRAGTLKYEEQTR